MHGADQQSMIEDYSKGCLIFSRLIVGLENYQILHPNITFNEIKAVAFKDQGLSLHMVNFNLVG